LGRSPIPTLTLYPAKTSHQAFNEQELKKANISKGLIHISKGLENIDDIFGEFDKVLEKI
jgi:O-acetylhomoserine/O-acetylserine sulfhydrylase-like pyridoxal-dependent enzyme